MKKRVLSIFLTAMVTTITLSGCGKSNTTSGTTSGDSKTEKVTITYVGWGSPTEKNSQAAAIKKFEERNPNIKVNYQHIPTDYETKLSTMIAANTPPDVGMLGKTIGLSWGEQGKIYNLLPLLEKDTEVSKDSYIDGTFVYGNPDTIVGMTPAQEVFGLFYNKDMFKQAGVDSLPTKAENALTWDQFVEVAKKLTIDQNGKNALDPKFDHTKIKQYGVKTPNWAWQTYLVLNDTRLISEDGTKLNLTDPAVAETLQRFADLINVHHVAPSPAQEKSLPAPAVALQSKKVAIDWDGQWVQQDLGAAKVNFDVGIIPKMKTTTNTLFGELQVIFQGSKHPNEAWKLIKWLCEPEAVLDLHASGLWLPTKKDYYTKPELISKWADVKPGHSEGFKDAIMTPAMNDSVPDVGYYLKNSTAILSVISPALDQVWLGKKTAAEALKEIEPKAAKEFKGVYMKVK